MRRLLSPAFAVALAAPLKHGGPCAPFAIAIGLGGGCGGGFRGGNAAPVAPVPTSSASARSTGTTAPRAICARICKAQHRCGGDEASCVDKCLPIVRVLQSDVAESMARCKEQYAQGTCEEGKEAADRRKHDLARCTVDSTKGKEAQANVNIELFAKTFCEARRACGAEGSFNPSTCLGEAKGAIRTTQGEASGALYGAIRPSRIDDVVACMQGPCEQRRPEADLDLERCLTLVLAKAAEEKS